MQGTLPATTDTLTIGSSLCNGKYVIKQVKGQGGFGITYFASFQNLGTRVAIKECFLNKFCKRVNNTSVTASISKYEEVFKKYKEKFLEEAKNIASCNHPNIIKITDYFEENNTVYYVMEYIDGVTLQDLVSSKHVLSEADSILFIKQIAEALQIVHNRGLVHRDVKPSNIMIRDNDDAILIDFGAALDILDDNPEHTVILTEGFAPPEQYQRSGTKGFQIDLYALGATLYYCLTGKIPLSAQQRIISRFLPPIEFNPNVSTSLNNIVMKAMEMDILNRHSKISNFLYELTTSSSFDPSNRLTLTDSQKSAKANLEEFIVDPQSQAFILSGPVFSGKTYLIHDLIEIISKQNRDCHVLSVSSRLAETIRNNNKLSKVTSIFQLMYDFEAPIKFNKKDHTEQEDENTEKINFDLKGNNDSERTIYIIDEAHLLSDLYLENELFVFGSGKPLFDFIQYVNLKYYPNRKVIFIGDDKQILRGGEEESSMSESHLKNTYSISAKYFELKETIIQPEYSPILKEALQIRESISNNSFNNYHINESVDKVIQVTSNLFKDSYLKSTNNQNSIIINYSNKQVLHYNIRVREILGRKEIIEAGDKIITYNRFLANPNESYHVISAGEVGEIIKIDGEPITHIQYIKNKPPINLTFIKVLAFFPRTAVTASILILKEFLVSENTKLSIEQQIGLKIRAKENLKQKQVELGEDIKLSLFEDEYANVGLVKYAYAMTCHKAQGIKWDNVFIDFETDTGKTNKTYYRWSYTALTRAKSKVFFMNAPKVTPFYNLNWLDNSDSFDPNFKISPLPAPVSIPTVMENDAVKYNFPSDKPFLKEFWVVVLQKLKLTNIVIDQIEHKPYQELYHFSNIGGQLGKILFHYNGKNVFTKRILQPVSPFTNQIVQLIDIEDNKTKIYERAIPVSFLHDFLKDFYFLLRNRLKDINAVIYSYDSIQYQEKYTVCREFEIAELGVFYNSEGFVSSVRVIKFNSEVFLKELKSLIVSFKQAP